MQDRPTLRVMLAQLNPIAGDIAGNLARARAAYRDGRKAGVDLVMLPEMFLSGYQVLDLSVRPAFLRDCGRALDTLAAETEAGPALGIGAPVSAGRAGEAEQLGGGVYNAYHLLQHGKIRAQFDKHHRPNYGVFDEKRLYLEGPIAGPVEIGGCRVGFPICEDAWFPDVAEAMEEAGAEMLLVPNGSPYEKDKHDLRQQLMVSRVVETSMPLVYLNLVGAQDDQVFDGGSFGLNRGGALALQLPFFEEVLEVIEIAQHNDGWQIAPGRRESVPDRVELDYRAMVLATRDYVMKSGFSKVILGLSGGVDSALVATIAADALGPSNVRCVMLPSRYTSDHSLEDAADLAGRLGAVLGELPISGAVSAVEQGLAPFFNGHSQDVTEENLQSRLRGLYLMALSNKFGELLLTTGNKSEVAVGYATLYGDMNGAFNPIKDLYKTRVFETCRWRNENHRDWMHGPAGVVIPGRIISKPPSAELREGQKDEDSLPPYPVLDDILERLVEADEAVEEVVAAGHQRETVEKVQALLYASEFKRFQSAPGTKLTKKAFWLDRRYPLINRWRDRG
ncbi:MAG: NAD+ synthase [Pseudomonadota bacterium]